MAITNIVRHTFADKMKAKKNTQINWTADSIKNKLIIIPAGTTYRQEVWKEIFELYTNQNNDLSNFKCSIKPNPTNKFDSNSIEIYIKNKYNGNIKSYQVGYISKDINVQLLETWNYIKSINIISISNDVYDKYYGGLIEIEFNNKPKKPSRFQLLNLTND